MTAERTKRKGRRKRARQEDLPYPAKRGGARRGAGRKPNGSRAGVSHLVRSPLASRNPVHVTARLEKGLPGLRRDDAYQVLRRAFAAGSERFGFRLVHYTVMSNHLHLIVEAKSRQALSRGMQGLLIRVAKALNRLWERKGTVFADRYHGRILRTPREVRAALAYVLRNAAHHGLRFTGVDPFSSGEDFDGWEKRPERGVTGPPPVLAKSRSYLLRSGWRRRRLIGFAEIPGAG